MNRDDIIERMGWMPTAKTTMPDVVSRIEAIVRAAEQAEREACAKVCDCRVDDEYATGKVDHNEQAWTQALAAAIRARGEQ